MSNSSETQQEQPLATLKKPTVMELSLRVVLGGLFIWAGSVKLIDLKSFVESVGYFKIPPFDLQPWDMWLGYTLPAFELIVGSCLILGILYRGALLSTLAMSAGFLAAIYSVHVRNINIECGCFGKALSFGNYYIHMAALAAMVLAALILVVREWLADRG